MTPEERAQMEEAAAFLLQLRRDADEQKKQPEAKTKVVPLKPKQNAKPA